jgi:RNA polymerase sigma-70 factor (ECF subfamily)
MPDQEWESLLARLDDDLEARSRGDISNTDEAAWEEVQRRVLRYSHMLSSRAQLEPDTATEIAQEILIKLQNPVTLRRLKAAGAPDGYLFVIVRNQVLDTIRRNRKTVSTEVPLTEELISAYEIRQEPARIEKREQLEIALQSLRSDDRALLHMRFWQELGIAQIAERTGLKYSAVAVRLFRILKNLREKLGPNY